jgi:hypothetical protein
VTSVIERELTCKACSARSSYSEVASTNSFGYPDLDLRPAGMAREALLNALLQCKNCGYCAPDISEGPDAAGEIINSECYLRAIADSAGPALAGRWRRWALVSERAGDRATAGWANLQAAWASEDAREEDAAGTYRAIALEHLSGCADAGVQITEDAESQQLLLLDLQRRIGRCAEAMEIAGVVTASTTTDEVREIARFQAILIQREDRRRYSVGDAKEYAASPEKWLRRRDKKDTRQWWQFWR